MDEEENQDETQDNGVPVFDPSVVGGITNYGTTSWGLPDNFVYPTRRYIGAATPELEQMSRGNIFRGGDTGEDEDIWNLPPVGRFGKVSPGRFKERLGRGQGGYEQYNGPNLIGPSGKIERSPYSLDNSSVLGELMSLGDRERKVFLRYAYALGLYSTKQGPSSTGTQSRDVSAWRQLLLVSNAKGYTWDMTLNLMVNDPQIAQSSPGSSGSGGRRIGTSDELAMVFANATHEMLGRAPTNKEVNDYIRAYRSGGMSASATAETLVTENAGPEEDAYGYAQMAELLTRMLGGS